MKITSHNMIILPLTEIDDANLYQHYASRGFTDLWFDTAAKGQLYQEYGAKVLYHYGQDVAWALEFETEARRTLFLLKWR